MPLVFFVGAFICALLTVQIDRANAAGVLPFLKWALGSGSSEVQTILSVVAGASISVLTLVFSSALVALTLAASQFGSFLLHDFIRMRVSRLTLSMFVASFVFSLTVLTRVGTGTSDQFVPRISSMVAVLLAFCSLALLVGFIYTISVSLQAQQVAALVAVGLRRAIDERQRATASEVAAGNQGEPAPDELVAVARHLDENGAHVTAWKSGYLQFVAFQHLVSAAEQAGGVIRQAIRPGQFVLAGSALADVWPPQLATSPLAGEIRRAHVIGSQRTLQQDLEFAIDKLVQIALVALSDAVNNTFNAIICLDWLADGLRMLAEQPGDKIAYCDAHGSIRIITQPLPFTAIIDAAFSKIRYASGGNPTIIIHLLWTIGRLAPFLTAPEQRDALLAQADEAVQTALYVLTLQSDRSDVLECYKQTCQSLERPTHLERLHAGSVPPAVLP